MKRNLIIKNRTYKTKKKKVRKINDGSLLILPFTTKIQATFMTKSKSYLGKEYSYVVTGNTFINEKMQKLLNNHIIRAMRGLVCLCLPSALSQKRHQ